MNELSSKIESLLFISGRPMSSRELADLIKAEVKDIEEAGEKLIAECKEKNSGMQVIKNGSSFQMVTSSDNAELIQQFVKDETTGELSRPSLETLTIIAYRGPVAKTDLDRIRGINCSLILRNLLIRGLIDSRDDKKKDEIYYTVTFDFLRFLGLNDVKELPDYEKLSQDDTIDRILEDNPIAEKLNNNQQSLGLPDAEEDAGADVIAAIAIDNKEDCDEESDEDEEDDEEVDVVIDDDGGDEDGEEDGEDDEDEEDDEDDEVVAVVNDDGEDEDEE
jgi:segregation and condensation protein B